MTTKGGLPSGKGFSLILTIVSPTQLSTMGTNLLKFDFDFETRLGLVGSKLEVGVDSPFARIGLNQPFATVACEQMTLRVDAPKSVGLRCA